MSVYGNDLVLSDGDITITSTGDLYTSIDFERSNQSNSRFNGYHNILFSIVNRLLTFKGDNVYYPDYGSELYSVLSTPNSATLKSSIKKIIENSLLEDDRISTVDSVTVEQRDKTINVKAEVTLIGRDGVSEFVFPQFYLE